MENSLSRPVDETNVGIDSSPRQLAGRASTIYVNSETEPDEEEGVSFGFILHSLALWWKVALPIALLAAVGSAALIWHYFEPSYEAGAWVRIASRTPYLAYQTVDDQEPVQFVQTQIELLRSSLVAVPVASRPEVARLPEVQAAEDPVDMIRGGIRVKQIGQSELYEITFNSHDAQQSAVIVNAIVDEYFGLRGEDENAQTQRVLELLQNEQEQRSSEVQKLRDELRKMGLSALGADPLLGAASTEGATATHPALQLQDRLADTEVETKLLEAQLKAAQEILEKKQIYIPDLLIEQELSNAPEFQAAMAGIAEQVLRLREIEQTSVHGSRDPDYVRLKNLIEQQRLEAAQIREVLRPMAKEKLMAMSLIRQQDQVVQLGAELEGNRLLEEMLHDRYVATLEEIKESGDPMLNQEFLRAELARVERVFDMISDRMTALQTELRAPSRVALTKRAEAPNVPLEMAPWASLAVAIVVSFALPFGTALTWEWHIRRIANAAQLEIEARLPVVAEVARLPSRLSRLRLNPFGQGARAALAVVEESVDSLRTCLQLGESKLERRVIAVTSAVSGEGKTTVASQLAASIARATGAPTLLIDADMRAPDMHSIFQVSRQPGLAQALEGSCTLEEAIVSTWSRHLHVLPAGVPSKSPHFLVGNGSFGRLIAEARKQYAHIIIDTPPILAAAESLVIATTVDDVVLCAMQDSSRESQVRLAHDRLTAAGIAPSIGVLNAVDLNQYASRYGGYRYKHSTS